MNVKAVDPRDTTWEDVQPVFRVSFWDERNAWASHEYEISGADVVDVVSWAESSLGELGTEFTLSVKVVRDNTVGVVVLAGRDPTAPHI